MSVFSFWAEVANTAVGLIFLVSVSLGWFGNDEGLFYFAGAWFLAQLVGLVAHWKNYRGWNR